MLFIIYQWASSTTKREVLLEGEIEAETGEDHPCVEDPEQEEVSLDEEHPRYSFNPTGYLESLLLEEGKIA
ncbi:MAG: hypothetical protein KDD45_15140 [Bdellovibrionales bacterium]|nr:hypothetical protein [Bdellovibrionales bacterium]